MAVCDLCGAGVYRVVYDLDGFQIVRCRECGLVYRDPMPAGEQLYAMYNTGAAPSAESIVQYYRDFRRRSFRRMFQAAQEAGLTCNGGRFFDVGAGKGWSYAVARAFGCVPFGMDLSLANCRQAAREGFTVQADSEQLPAACASMDMLLMSDVLEHVREPRRVLGEARRVLKPGGALVVRVPDASGLLIRAMDTAYWLSGGRFKRAGRTLYRVHLYGFTAGHVVHYLDETGFEPVLSYGESSKNLDALEQKRWARNPLVRLGVRLLTRLGEWTGRMDEVIVVARCL